MDIIKDFLTGYSIEIETVSTIIITIATVVLACLTAIYVRHTKYMADEMKLVREPAVYLDFEVPSYFIKLIIGNSGYTPALNISFKIINDLKWITFGDDVVGFSNIPIIKKGISYLAPNRTLKFFSGNLSGSTDDDKNNELRLTMNFENEDGKKFIKEVFIDLSIYRTVLFETFKDSQELIQKKNN